MITEGVDYSFVTRTVENVSSLLEIVSDRELRQSLLTFVDLTDRMEKLDWQEQPVL